MSVCTLVCLIGKMSVLEFFCFIDLFQILDGKTQSTKIFSKFFRITEWRELRCQTGWPLVSLSFFWALALGFLESLGRAWTTPACADTPQPCSSVRAFVRIKFYNFFFSFHLTPPLCPNLPVSLSSYLDLILSLL